MKRSRNKTPQHIIDKLLCDMKDEDRKYFFKMCQFNANYADLKNYLEEKTDYEIDITTIARWFKYNRPTGNEAILINKVLDNWEGINPQSLIHLSAGICAKLILEIENVLDLENTSNSAKLTNLVELLKELRQISAEINRADNEKDTTEIYKSGIIALADELRIIFKNTPIQTALEHGLSSAINRIS